LSYLSSINFKLLKSQYEEAKDQRLETGFFPLRSQLGVCVTPQKHAFKPNPSIPSPARWRIYWGKQGPISNNISSAAVRPPPGFSRVRALKVSEKTQKEPHF
jgi:hypothetical protein